MPLNTNSLRTDVVFLRRRLRQGEVVATAAPKKLSISLSGAVKEAKKVSARNYLKKNVVLNSENPVVRLTNRQSAIGSLIIENATEFAWDAEGLTGLETVTSEDPHIPTFGNRKLVQFQKYSVVISGRHFKKIRRVAVRNNGGNITLTTNSNLTVTIENSDSSNVLYLSRIGNEIEVRCEKIVDNNLASTFNF